MVGLILLVVMGVGTGVGVGVGTGVGTGVGVGVGTGVGVGVGTGVGVGGIPPSKAPRSRTPIARTPRWSDVVGVAPPAVLLASAAILTACRAKVWVEPPLLARVVSITVLAAPVGIIGVTPVKLPKIPLAPFVPTMLAPLKLRIPPSLRIS